MVFDIPQLAFPLKPSETATSYVSRLTRYCGLGRPSDLCLDFGFTWQQFVRGDTELCTKLANITGINPDILRRNAIRTTGRGRYSIHGHDCSRGTLLRSRIRVCPECIREDIIQSGNDGVFRRDYWQMASIRTCAVHATSLVTLPPAKSIIDNYDFVTQVEKHGETLQWNLLDTHQQQTTPFEAYVTQRLRGKKQHRFLDSLSMHAATRLCETLGHALCFGETTKVSETSETMMWQAGQAGFEALATGEKGLIDALRSLRTGVSLHTMRQRRDLGALYEWLRVSTLHDEVAPIRRIVRDYVFNHYPIPPGFVVLGTPCPERSVFTIEAACEALGVRRKRMNRYLLSRGIAKKGKARTSVDLLRPLKKTAIDNLSEKMEGRVTMPQALKLLNIGEKVLRDLCEIGLVVQRLDDLDQLPKYNRSELEKLLNLLSQKSNYQACDQESLMPLACIAKKLRCRSAEIVAMVIAGQLNHVAGSVSMHGIKGLRLDIDQVRSTIPWLEMPGITRMVASTTLHVSYPTINYLVNEGLLTSARMRNPRSRQFQEAICDGSVEAFLKKYDTLGLMAIRYRRKPGPFGCHLVAKGICPLETPKGISWIYERTGLHSSIERLGIKPRVQTEGG